MRVFRSSIASSRLIIRNLHVVIQSLIHVFSVRVRYRLTCRLCHVAVAQKVEIRSPSVKKAVPGELLSFQICGVLVAFGSRDRLLSKHKKALQVHFLRPRKKGLRVDLQTDFGSRPSSSKGNGKGRGRGSAAVSEALVFPTTPGNASAGAKG
ncbi:hypothetical protein TNIN_27601 [Trichonephila inaurata madagascariensis]|uniref:Uncharacterized protein n=1 Tax=Trichonephila inaurata madagascariensis TaxID=2747483 RepID=A0A8X7CKF5_9ARAC|nr:hypothetical protein TNIN_27601 [Trichonephila inaurata madagascariensis]